MRYIIVDTDQGVFLGTREDPGRRGVGMLFSENNLYDLTRAASWKSEKEAQDYLHHYIKRHLPESFVAAIESDSEHVDVVDIIKSGYGSYCAGMIEAIPMHSIQIH